MSSPNAPPALDRAGRKACWEARDAFFQCLNLHNVPVPPEAGGTGKHSSTCLQERERYEQDCPKSWVDYFNKRRVLEIRQRMTVEAGLKQQEGAQTGQ
ncbi:hypothetical protein NCC49_005202 [Naganishia albida]|nr:hypothetical protein NCC49_005202 [Naganishia albida]